MNSPTQSIERELEDRGFADVARDIARRHNVPLYLLLGREKCKSISRARQELYAEIKVRSRLSFPEIGKLLGRHHTTILQGVRQFHSQAASEPETRIRVAV